MNLVTFDLETGMRVASKVGNLPCKFGHARPLGSRIIRYVRDGQMDRQTDKSNAYCPIRYKWGIIRKLWKCEWLMYLPSIKHPYSSYCQQLSTDQGNSFAGPGFNDWKKAEYIAN